MGPDNAAGSGSAILANGERLYTLEQAARFFPSGRTCHGRNRSTVYRYSTHGLRGIVLETVDAGGIRCTSREAIRRFFGALSIQAKLAAVNPDVDGEAEAVAAGERLKQLVFRSRKAKGGAS